MIFYLLHENADRYKLFYEAEVGFLSLATTFIYTQWGVYYLPGDLCPWNHLKSTPLTTPLYLVIRWVLDVGLAGRVVERHLKNNISLYGIPPFLFC